MEDGRCDGRGVTRGGVQVTGADPEALRSSRYPTVVQRASAGQITADGGESLSFGVRSGALSGVI